MAIHNDFKKSTKDSLNENLIAIKFCLDFEKKNSPNWPRVDQGCLGTPALILLSSIIDTIGSYFRGTSTKINVDNSSKQIETASDHFLILNHEQTFDLKLSKQSIDNFYEKYRSPITHNGTLPINITIDLGSDSDSILESNTEGEIALIRLKPLFNAVDNAVKKFIYYLDNGNWSSSHKLRLELIKKGVTKPMTGSPSASGSR